MDATPAAAPAGLDLLDEPVALYREDGLLVWANGAHRAWFGDTTAFVDVAPSARWERVVRAATRYGAWRHDSEPAEGSDARPMELRVRPTEAGLLFRALDASRTREKVLMLQSYAQLVETHQARLERQKARLELVLDHLQHAVFCVDRAGRIVAPISRAASERFGIPVEKQPLIDTLFRGLERGSAERARAEQALESTLGADRDAWQRHAQDLPTRATLPGGRPLTVHYSPVWSESGIVQRLIVVVEEAAGASQAPTPGAVRSTREMTMVEHVAALLERLDEARAMAEEYQELAKRFAASGVESDAA